MSSHQPPPQRPALVITIAVGLFVFAALLVITTLMLLITLVAQRALFSAGLLVVLWLGFFGGLLIATGIGLLNRKQWARICAIVLFSLLLVSGASSLMVSKAPNPSANTAYRMGQATGQFLMFSLSSLGIYSLGFNQKVKRYFRA